MHVWWSIDLQSLVLYIVTIPSILDDFHQALTTTFWHSYSRNHLKYAYVMVIVSPSSQFVAILTQVQASYEQHLGDYV